MLKTDLEILEYIKGHPDHRVIADDLRAFVGVDADRRLYQMKSAGLIRYHAHWYDDAPAAYGLDARGEDLLATHEKEQEEARQRKAEEKEELRQKTREEKAETSKNRRFDLFSAIIGAIVTAIVTVLIEKFFG